MKLFPYGLLIAALVFIADQMSKWFLIFKVDIFGRAPIEITNFFNLVVVWNRGVSFGMFSKNPEDFRWVLIFVAVAISIWLGMWLKKSTDRFEAQALGLIIGGAIGNIVDRFRFGAVFDFLDFHLMGWHYPAFNVADSGIVIGVLCLLINGFLRRPSPSA